MTMAIMQMRLTTLYRQILKHRVKLGELQQKLDLIQTTNSNAVRLYKTYYAQSDTSKLEELEPVLQLTNYKEEDIELEITATNSVLAQENEEYKNVKKWIEENAKKETAHYTMSS